MKHHSTYRIPQHLVDGTTEKSSVDTKGGNGPLGIFTKTHVNLTTKGFQRVHEFLLQDQSAKLLPKERVCNCLKRKIKKDENRSVKYKPDTKKAHWSNVQRCDSLWTCPVCAKRISEGRRSELQKGVKEWKSRGGSVFLMTLTFSHSKQQPLKGLLEGQKKSLKRFYETTKVQSIFKELGLFGKVKSLEITYGKNGWHPHNHILMMTEFNLTTNQLHKAQAELSELWIKACTKSGLNAPNMTHGLDLRDGTYAEKYVSKWGIEQEVTKGIVKKGKADSYNPFDILNLSVDDKDIHGSSASKVFQEYGIATKGVRQLEWGRGLKKELLIDEVSDDELQAEKSEDVELSSVDDYTFEVIKAYQKRHEFLIALADDYEANSIGNGKAETLLIDLFEREAVQPKVEIGWNLNNSM